MKKLITLCALLMAPAAFAAPSCSEMKSEFAELITESNTQASGYGLMFSGDYDCDEKLINTRMVITEKWISEAYKRDSLAVEVNCDDAKYKHWGSGHTMSFTVIDAYNPKNQYAPMYAKCK